MITSHDLRNDVKVLRKLRENAKNDIEKIQVVLDGLLEDEKVHREAIMLCQACCDAQLANLKPIEDAITSLLHRTMGESYSFRYESVYKDKSNVILRGIEPIVNQDGNEQVVEATGGRGALQNMIGVGQMLCLGKIVGAAPVLFIDEGLSNVKEDKFQGLADFIQELNAIDPVQVFIITQTEARFKQTLRVTIPGGRTSRVESIVRDN